MSEERDDAMVVPPELEYLIEAAKRPLKSISQDGGMTILEFEGGGRIQLAGGGAQILDYQEPCCSFCGKSKTTATLLAAPPGKNEPLICPDCAVSYVELFAGHGIEIKLNISKISPDLADQLASLNQIGDLLDPKS